MSERKWEKAGAAACLIFLWLLSVLAAGAASYRSYREKAELLTLVMETEDDVKLERVTQYLKGQAVPEAGDGAEQLEALGFTRDYPDLLKKRLYRDWLQSAALITAVFGAAALLIWDASRRERRRRKHAEQEVCAQIARIRSGGEQTASAHSGKQGACTPLNEAEASVFFRDGEYAQIQMELASLSEQVRLITEQALQEKEETKALVTDLSHQLRTPVMALQASFDALVSNAPGSAQYEEFLVRCRTQMERLSELLSALLQISRMETGMIEITPVKKPLFDTLLQAVNRIYPQAAEKDMEIILEESPEQAENQIVLQDEKWLAEAIINVLENAVKYSERGTAVRIRAQKLMVSLRLEIEDEGPGVAPEERSRIFQRFYRSGDARIQAKSGQGIGLYLARQIIEMHGGTIRVTDARPHGSRFIIQLPLIGA